MDEMHHLVRAYFPKVGFANKNNSDTKSETTHPLFGSISKQTVSAEDKINRLVEEILGTQLDPIVSLGFKKLEQIVSTANSLMEFVIYVGLISNRLHTSRNQTKVVNFAKKFGITAPSTLGKFLGIVARSNKIGITPEVQKHLLIIAEIANIKDHADLEVFLQNANISE